MNTIKINNVLFGLLFLSINLCGEVKTLKEQAAEAYVASRLLEAIKEDLDQNKLNAELQEVLVPRIISKYREQFGTKMFNVLSFDCWYGTDVVLVAFSSDSKYALAGFCGSKVVHVCNVDTGKTVKILTGHTDNIYAIAFSPDDTHVLTASGDNTIRLWDLATADTVKVLNSTSCAYSVAFSSDGTKALAGLGDGRACLWDLITGQLIRVFAEHNDFVSSVAFNPDNTQILTGSGDGKTLVWDIFTGQLIKIILRNGYIVTAAVFNSDGTQVLTGSLDGTVRLWDSTTDEVVTVFKGSEKYENVRSIAFNRDCTRVIIGYMNGNVCVRDLETAKIIHDIQDVAVGFTPVSAVTMSCDAKYILKGSQSGMVRLVDLYYGNTLKLAEVLDILIPLVNFKYPCSIM